MTFKALYMVTIYPHIYTYIYMQCIYKMYNKHQIILTIMSVVLFFHFFESEYTSQ